MRQLATIRQIANIEPIEGADFIAKVTIDGWECVAKKKEFNIGDLCIYFEIDSILPEHEVFEFMRSRKFRVKTAKFRKQISQGLVMPIDILSNWSNKSFNLGDDVTDVIGVKKHDPYAEREARMLQRKKKNVFDRYLSTFNWYRVIRRKIVGKGSHNFPYFISKTDEPRIQNNPRFAEQHIGREFYITEKLDGMSGTYAYIPGFIKSTFYVCSRNIWLWRQDNSEWWEIAYKYDIKSKLKAFPRMAVQGEIIGPKCNGNRLGLKELDFYVFNVIDIKKQRRLNLEDKLEFCNKIGLKPVPIVNPSFWMSMPYNTKYFIEMSAGKSAVNTSNLREGIVLRQVYDDHVSVKAINPEYLLKYGD